MKLPFDTAEAVEVGGEAALVKFFVDFQYTEWREPLIQFDPASDRICLEMSMRFGRADIVIFHGDGSVTVIEAKDGTKGYQHVAAGIGQVTLYATQLALAGTIRKVRRALLWSSTEDDLQDLTLCDACKLAGVLALPSPSMRVRLDIARAVLARFTKEPA